MLKITVTLFKCAIIILLSIYLSLSCSNEVPHIISQKTVIVFDFSLEDEKDTAVVINELETEDDTESLATIENTAKPKQRLSVFAQDNDVERIKEFRLDFAEEGLSWKTHSPSKIILSDGEWVGSSHFFMQGNRSFPIGEYGIKLTNYTGNSSDSVFVLEYPEELANAPIDTTIDNLVKEYSDLSNFYTTLYNSDYEMMFFSETRMTENEIDEAVQNNPDIAFVQTYIESASMPYAVLFPMKALFVKN